MILSHDLRDPGHAIDPTLQAVCAVAAGFKVAATPIGPLGMATWDYYGPQSAHATIETAAPGVLLDVYCGEQEEYLGLRNDAGAYDKRWYTNEAALRAELTKATGLPLGDIIRAILWGDPIDAKEE